MKYALILPFLFAGYKWFVRPYTPAPTAQTLNIFTLHKKTNTQLPHIPHMSMRTAIERYTNNTLPKTITVPLHKQRLTVCQGIHIPKSDPPCITLYSRGWTGCWVCRNGVPCNGKGLISAYTHMRNGIMPLPCVTFDYQDDRRSFNFAQDLDQNYLATVHNTLVQKYPHTRIMLMGNCLGTLQILKFLATRPKNIHNVVLLSPFISFDVWIEHIYQQYVQCYCGTLGLEPFRLFLRWYFPSYNAQKENLYQLLPAIKGYRILLVHRKTDIFTPLKKVQQLTHALSQHNTVQLFISDNTDASHGNLSYVPEVQELIKKFLSF